MTASTGWARRGLGPALIGAATAAMATWTWGTWPDAVVDFGRELYVPWQMLEGRVLYRDLQLFYGPFSPHLNAAWFAAFGVSLRSLVFLNLLVVAAVAVLVYRESTRFAGRLAATLAGLSFALAFAFNSYTRVGNYNWIAPYSHELTHGVALSLAALWALRAFLERGRSSWAAAAGGLIGLVFLTKPEVFLAVTCAAGLALALWLRPRSGCPKPEGVSRPALAFAVGLAAPLCLAVALLSVAMPPGDALFGVMGSWPHVLNSEISSMPFYRRGLGVDDVGGNLAAAARGALGFAWWFAPALLVALARGPRRRTVLGVGGVLWLAVGAWTCGAAALGPLQRGAPLDALDRFLGIAALARPWPILLGLLLAALLLSLWRRADTDDAPRAIARIAWVTFALALLAKMVLNARIWHYGFALAMPAALVLVIALVDGVPVWLRRRGGDMGQRVFRASAVLGWGLVATALLGLTAEQLATKYVVVGEGADAYRADTRGVVVAEALHWLNDNARSGQTLAVLPGGEILGYLARLPNPTPYGNFTPGPVLLFGEQRMLEALRSRPPDWVALVHRDTAVFGARYLGTDYGLELAAWIDENYEPAFEIGAPPFNPRGQMGARILRKNASAESRR